MSIKKWVGSVALGLGMLAAGGPALAETPVGSNIDSRVVVALKVNQDGMQAMLPVGWASFPFPGGPTKGANLLALFIDSGLEMDPEGQPIAASTRRAVAFAGLAKQGDAVRLYVVNYLTTFPEIDPYGVGSGAEITRSTTLAGASNGPRESSDEWRVSTDDGGEMVLSMEYTTGKRGWSSGELFPHSALNPDFSRIYRFEQMADLVSSTAIGKPSSGDFSLTSNIAALDAIFDGTEEVIAVIDVPVYLRHVSLP